jgi:hypothetical protein
MKKKIIALSVLSIAVMSAHAGQSKKLFLFNDLSSYQEKITTDIDGSEIIEMPNKTVLDSFKYQVFQDGKRINLDRVKIIPKSEKNIFVVNEGKKIKINDDPEAILVAEGPDFIKTRSFEENDIAVKYTSKEKIYSIQFEKNIDSQSHIAEIIPFSDIDDAEINVSYTLGELKWEPKYNLNLLPGNKAILDYFIEIENKTNMDFENVNLAISTDSISRINKDYSNGITDYIFTVFKEASDKNPQPPQPVYYQSRSKGMEMMSMDASHASQVVSKMGKESIVFGNTMNISSNSKSSLDYDIDNEFEYKKENTSQLQFSNKEYTYNPKTTVEVLRKDDKDSMKMVPGVISVYADRDIYNGQLVNEVRTGKINKSQNLFVSIGDNNNIEIKTSKKEKAKYSIFTESLNQGRNDINVNIHSGGSVISKNSYRLFEKKIIVEDVTLKVNSKNIAKNETLKINSGNIVVRGEGNKHKVLEELQNIAKQSANKSISDKDYRLFMNKLSKEHSRALDFNEKQLKKGIKEKIYVISIQNQFLSEVKR